MISEIGTPKHSDKDLN